MTCQRMRRLLTDDLAQPRSEHETVDTGAHLRSCPACRSLRHHLAAVEDGLRELVRELPDRKVDTVGPAIDRVQARRGGKRNGWRAPLARSAWWLSLGSAAAALLLLTFYGWGRGHGQAGHRSTVAMGPRSVQARRVLPAIPQSPGGEILTQQPKPAGGAEHILPPHTAAHGSNNAPRARGHRPLTLSTDRWRSVVDDLAYVNRDPGEAVREWAPLPRDEWEQIEARLRSATRVRDDFVTIPFPRLASISNQQIAQAVEGYKREAAIVDPRLSHEVTCAFKATALFDLCDRLRADTDIQLSAGSSVADGKVTLFCEKMPLREVMRQLSRPFGYTWLRSKKEGGEYRYQLVQDLKSQLLEEELRNRDRNAALLALEQEMSGYRRYLELSPDEALARARSASSEEKQRLEHFSSSGWGPIQLYFRLSPHEQAILRSGQKLTFGMDGELAGKVPGLIGGAGVQPLPPELRQDVLQSQRDRHVVRRDGSYRTAGADDPGGIPLTAAPEAQPIVTLELHQSELGQFTLDGHSGFAIFNPDAAQKVTYGLTSQGPLASGRSPAVLQPNNRKVNAKLAGDPTLRARVSFQPHPSCGAPREAGAPSGPAAADRKVTSADVLEAIHQATGRPVIGDSFTRLYKPEMAAVRDQSLFDALNQVADTMHLRWAKDDAWLQFRSSSYFNDRLKEVPNRLLARWTASCRQHGGLTLDDLLEIAQLSDAQLDARDMAEGARDCWGLAEWDLSRGSGQRPHLRYLAQLTPAQRQAALTPAGLAFAQMSLAQQQQFISLRAQNIQSLEELTGATLRVGYTHPGEFQWAVPEADLPGRGAIGLSLVHERTREAALQAARRINPQVDSAQITPTELALTLVYTLGSPRTGVRQSAVQATSGEVRMWGHDFPPSGGAVPPRAGS
jgi:hypothetical protein